MLLEQFPSLNQYKIQPDKPMSRQDFWKCFLAVWWSHIFVQLPMQLMFHPVAEWFGMTIYGGPLPTWFDACWQILFFMIIEVRYCFR
jgi:hypothetical protein